MPVLDDRRSELADAARTALGDEPAATLMELLVPTGDIPATKSDIVDLRVATKSDLETATAETHARFDEMAASTNTRFDDMAASTNTRFDEMAASTNTRFDEMAASTNTRFDEMAATTNTRFDEMAASTNTRFDRIEATLVAMDKRIDVQHHELIAIFRGELNDTTRGQARAVVQGVFTAIVGIAVLSLSFAQLLG